MPGSTTQISYNPINQTINYIANIPNKGYFSVGYGTSMYNTDMIVWFAMGATSSQSDLYSTSHDKPKTLTPNSYVTTFVVQAASTQFYSSRTLVASGKDTYNIPLDSVIKMIYAYDPKSSK